MTWFTWRQLRTQTWIAVAGLAVAAAVSVLMGKHLADLYGGVASCQTDCGQALSSFLNQAQSGMSGAVYNASIIVMYAVPPLIGAFWGAPLVARELEAGTHRLAWNQTVTRTRWLATKLAIVGGATVVTAGLLSLAITLAMNHIDHGNLIRPMLFGARGVVPAAYAAFAFALGVAAGVLTRRTVPAMAITLGVYAVVAVLMPLVVRAHLAPERVASATIGSDRSSVHGIMMDQHGRMRVLGNLDVPGAWVVSDHTLTPAGVVFTGPANTQACGEDGSPQSCVQWIGSLHLRQVLTYQPASHYWPLQWAESGLFVAFALLLAGFAMWWTRRRIA